MPTLEQRFSAFLGRLPNSRSLDEFHIDKPSTPRRADYTLHEDRVVVEIKSLAERQIQKGEAVIREYLDDQEIDVFGTLPLSRIANDPGHLDALERSIHTRMTRAIENICKSANDQIETEASKLPRLSTGLLVVLNEKLTELSPYTAARRIWDYTHSKRTNIHFCLLIFESHRISIDGQLRPYPLLMNLAYTARQRRTYIYLQSIVQEWAKENGYPSGLPSHEPSAQEFLPNEVIFGE